jgi:hypothetical protein
VGLVVLAPVVSTSTSFAARVRVAEAIGSLVPELSDASVRTPTTSALASADVLFVTRELGAHAPRTGWRPR